MNRVFVSYSRRNKTFAERIARDLSDAGLDVWIDFRQIHAGELWKEEIFRGIRRSEIVLVLLSPDAVESQWVQLEVQTARELNKLIIPVMVVEALPQIEASPELNWLANVHFIRFDTRYEAAFRELLDSLPGKRGVGAYDEVDPAKIPNPFKGLEAFQQTDSRFFFGREELVRKALNNLQRLRGARFLAIVGASGSGKSSLVRAGVIPQLRAGKLPKSETWRFAILTPGPDPLEALATRLSPLLGDDFHTEDIAARLRVDPVSLDAYADLLLQDTPPDVRLVLVVDQFEEVFTRAGEFERQAFIDLLYDAATSPEGRVQIIITMRADFFDRLGRYPLWAELFEQENLLIVTEMTTANLLRTIEGPARAVGLVYEDGLVDRILEDVRRQPGSLPLLQYALNALYERREGRYLTTAAYDAIGGVQKALAGHAEEVYQRLNAAQQDIMRRVLLRLVEVNESGEATRRRVAREDLNFRGVAQSAVQEIIDLMTAAQSRLLVASREIKPSDDVPTTPPVTWLEVSHEALIREWARFRGWIDENLEELRFGSELLKAATDWNLANRDVAYLLVGNRLTRAELWLQDADSSDLQEDFIQASIEERSRRDADRQQQLEREITLQRRAANRLRAFAVVLVVFLLVAVGLTFVAISERQRAEANALQAEANALEAAEQQRLAELNALESRSFALAASGERALSDGDRELAVALAVEAALITEDPPPQTRLTLSNVAYAPGTRRLIPDFEGYINAATYVAGDRYILTGSSSTSRNGALILWDANTGAQARTFFTQGSRVISAVANHAGTLIASGSNNGRITLWDAATGEQVGELSQQGQINAMAFSPDDSRLVTASANGTLYVWDVASRERRAELIGHTDSIAAVAFHPTNNDVFVTGSWDNSLRLWDLSIAQGSSIARVGHSVGVSAVAFTPDGLQLLVALRREPSAAPPLLLYDVGQIRAQGSQGVVTPLVEFETANIHTAEILNVVVSPDGTLFATGAANADNSIVLWDLASRTPLTQFTEHTDSLLTLAFNPDGSRLISGSRDRTLRVWDLRRAEIVRDFTGHNVSGTRGVVAVYGPGDRTILSGGFDGTLRLWDTESGLTMQEMLGHEGQINGVDLSDDGSLAVSGGADERVIVWDVASGAALFTLEPGNGTINRVRFLPESTQFVIGGERGGPSLWDAADGQRVRTFTAIPCPQADDNAPTVTTINTLVLSTDGSLLLTGGADECVTVWDTASGDPVKRFPRLGVEVRAVAISADNTQVAIGGINGPITLWRMDQDQSVASFTGHNRAVVGMAFSPDGSSLLSASADATVRLWDMASGFEVRRYTLASDDPVSFQSLEFSEFADTILTGLTDSTVRLWRLLPSIDGVLVWTFQNRYVPSLNCTQRVQFRLTPCDAQGNPPPAETFPVPPVPERPPSLLELAPGTEAVINSSAGDTIMLRRTPEILSTADGNVLTRLADGTPVTVLEGPVQGSGFTWWRVRTHSGAEGYVAEVLSSESLQMIVPLSAFDNLTTARYAS